jgi:hypothetical protein
VQRGESAIDDELYEIEVLDGEVVEHSQALTVPLNGERVPIWASPPVMQTAVAAATGFVCGAATLALLRRYGMARLERNAAAHAAGPLPSSRGGRTYIVHVRPLRPDAE